MNLEELARKRILVTGATGFLGKHLVNTLRNNGCNNIVELDSDSTLHLGGEEIVYERPQVVFHLAGYNGGIKFNQENQFDIFSKNTMMALNVINACKQVLADKLVSVVASCAYPAMTWAELEDWDELGYRWQTCEGYLNETQFTAPLMLPHESVIGHGMAKRNLQIASTLASKQYGLDAVCVCPTTLYGPGDSFDPKRTKVMGGMIQRFVKAKQEKLEAVCCWGTGSSQREFLYVKDAAELIVASACMYRNTNEPLNLGTGQEVTIKELATIVAKAVGYEGGIAWDNDLTKDGQMRKRLEIDQLRKLFPKINFTPLEQGIQETVDWYVDGL